MVHARTHVTMCKVRTHRRKRDILYPVGHLPLLSPDSLWKLRSFNPSEQSAINAFLICLESRDWGLWSNKLAFREGDTSHPLNPDVGLSATKVQQFFEIYNKYVHFLLKTWILDRKWLPLRHKRNWNYIRVGTDFILGNFIRVDTELF